MLREARTRFGKSQFGYLTSLIEPVAVIVTFTLCYSALGRVAPYGTSLPMFFALGTLAYGAFRRTSSFCTAAFEANQALLSYPIVQQVDTLIARAMLEFATTIFSCFVLIGGLMVISDLPGPVRVEAMACAIILMTMLGFGLGSISAVVSHYFASWRNIEGMLTRPLFFLSGILFVPDNLPPKIMDYLAWNPMLHGVEMMRLGYYADYRSTVLDVTYLVFWALVLILIGLAAERAMRVRSAFETGVRR